MERSGSVFGATALLVLAACNRDPVGPEVVPPPPPDAGAYVTGEALASLDEEGHFRLPSAAVEGPYAMILREEAAAIALGVIRTFYANPNVVTFPGAESLAESAERQHGAVIEWQAVQLGSRHAYFAESDLEPLPDSLGNPTIRHFGPHYLVPLFVDATPVVVVGVAAYATNIVLTEDGLVRRTDNLDGGGEFRVSGIPLALDGRTMPPSPETAVQFASLETRTKIIEVPVLGVPGNRVSRTGARWRLELSASVQFERVVDGGAATSARVYVGTWCSIADARLGGSTECPPRLRMFIEAETQPLTESIGAVDVPLREGYAVNLHEVRVR